MSLYIKICGLRTPADVAAAVEAGADAVGFVFSPSVRVVTPAHAATLARSVPGHVEIVAVTKHPTLALLKEIASRLAPCRLQTDLVDLTTLELPPGLRALPVLRSGGAPPTPLPARFLYEGATSGAGRTADWDEATRLARGGELILAGGLTPGNVADAITTVHPYGVDVSSGVESAPGVKHPELIHQFIARARAVARTQPGVEP